MAKDKILKPFVGIIAPENKFTADTIDDLKSRNYLTIGDIVDSNGYYTAGDGAHHKRKIEAIDNGGGIQLANGLWANVVHDSKINVLWFGAKNDGVFDNTSILQKILDTFMSTCLYFPKGTYMTDPLVMRYHQRLQGDGFESILKLKNNSTSTAVAMVTNEKITIKGKTYTCEHPEIVDMTIHGNKANNTILRNGVELKESWGGEMLFPNTPDARSYLNRVMVMHHTGNGIVGRSREYMITNSFSAQNDKNGMIMYNSDSYVSNFTSFQNKECGIISNGDDIKYSGVKCFGNGVPKNATDTAYPGFKATYPCTVVNLSVQENGGAGIECVQLSRSSFSGIFLSSNNLTEQKDSDGNPIPHATEQHQIKLINCYGQHMFEGVTLSDFRKTLVRGVIHTTGNNAYVTASITCDPNLKLDKTRIFETDLFNERVNFRRHKIMFDGVDLFRNTATPNVINTEANKCARVFRAKFKRVANKGSNIAFDMTVSAGASSRDFRIRLKHEEGLSGGVEIFEKSKTEDSRIEIFAGATSVTDEYVYFDVYANNIAYSFIDVKFDNFQGFNCIGLDTGFEMFAELPTYTKILSYYPSDWIKSIPLVTKTITLTNDNFKGSVISHNCVLYTGRVEVTKPTGTDSNLNIVSKAFALPDTGVSKEKIRNVQITLSGYKGGQEYLPVGFSYSWDSVDSWIHLKVAKSVNNESAVGNSYSTLLFDVSVVVDFN